MEKVKTVIEGLTITALMILAFVLAGIVLSVGTVVILIKSLCDGDLDLLYEYAEAIFTWILKINE